MPPPAAERGSATVTLATVAAVLLLLLAVIAGAVGGITGQEASACTAQPAASGAAASIPANYLADFKAAGTRYGIPWTVLAAIGDVARQTKLKIPTIRFYEAQGLLATPPRSPNGRRQYGEADIRRLEFIGRARELGFALNDIRSLLDLTAHPEQRCAEVLPVLFDALYAPERRYEHVWRAGDLVIWNNLAIQHARTKVAELSDGKRVMRRVQLGEIGFMAQVEQLRREAEPAG